MRREMREPAEAPCAVCAARFRKYRPNNVYCSDLCRRVGLERAVERQRRRREAAKAARAKGVAS